jgi:histidine ammonia-lyase
MLLLGKENLSINDTIKVACENEQVKLDETAISRVNQSHQRLENIVENGKPVYGINTGFGIFADKQIKLDQICKLNRNLILSHSVGTGEPLTKEIVRAAMLIRANTLAKGFSGVRLEVVQTLIEMLNKQITPVIPSQGSMGSSGDLCQLSQLALVISTDEKDLEEESGKAEFKGIIYSGKKAMEMAGIKRIILGPKEGLALNNGATFCAAMAALAVYESEYLIQISNNTTALSLEALLACPDAFDNRIHQARGHNGQIETAANIRELIAGSSLVGSTLRVQDAYSLRCYPQIAGATVDTLNFVKGIINKEINAATDNPLLFENNEVLSGGNFHGEPVGMAMDFLGIAMAEIGAVSERRIFRLTDGKLNEGLPPMLVGSQDVAGLNSGVMIPQYTAASLVLENQTLSTPDSVHSLPTSAEQEDHNANATTAARHCVQIISNVQHILSIEAFVSSRATDLRLNKTSGKLGKGSQKFYNKIRKIVPYLPEDSLWGEQINQISSSVKKHEL